LLILYFPADTAFLMAGIIIAILIVTLKLK
jgi:hypothetical protein